MLVEIIQIILFQSLFLFLYDFWLRKETFYNTNRVYLLGTSLLAIIIPFISFDDTSESIIGTKLLNLSLINPQNIRLPEVVLSTYDSIYEYSYVFWIYGIGILISSLFFLWKLFKLTRLIYTNKHQKGHDFVLVKLPETTKVFSFLNYVFIGSEIKDTIYLINHEKIHIKQRHSLDLLWFELLRIIFWFNPFVYIFQRRIAALHEFIADTESIKLSDSNTYYNHLLNDIFQVENMAFVNQFYNKSLIKKRITMMTKTQSHNRKLFKYLMIIPIIGLMLFSCVDSKENSKKVTILEEKIKNNVVNEEESVPFSVIDEVPIYPGCEDVEDKSEQKECLSKKIQAHVANNFNAKLAETLNLTPGKKRIFVMFMIDKDGSITGAKARAPHKDLEAEAIRVINTLPKMTPGKQKGEFVNIKYSLPISFIVEE